MIAGKLAPGAVTAVKLADGAVTAAKLAPGAIPPPVIDSLPDHIVTSDSIFDQAVVSSFLHPIVGLLRTTDFQRACWEPELAWPWPKR